jgi:hypothetical protein
VTCQQLPIPTALVPTSSALTPSAIPTPITVRTRCGCGSEPHCIATNQLARSLKVRDPPHWQSCPYARRSSPARAAASHSRARCGARSQRAHKPAMTRSRIGIIHRAAVLEAEDAIAAMIDRLTSPEPVRAEGMAIAERILTNVDRSPLYKRSEPGSLRRVVKLGTEAMEPRESQSHESPIAA